MNMDIQLDVAALANWGFSQKGMFLVAGPCSAETPEQLMETALALAQHPVSVFRAGIWKPRTRPGAFEGVGAKGLVWLKEAGEAAGIPVATEVAKPAHVEKCLARGIDALWIGARTAVNPFAVQEIADALTGVDIPVMVKNPVSPDLSLWIGALERINRSGIRRLAAVHRGFCSSYEKVYRNKPEWWIPIELRRRAPQLPLICDPSHICGSVPLLMGVAKKAMDLLFDGLMIECHIHPPSALSDAKQQVTPKELGQLLASLTVKKPSSQDPEYLRQLDHLRGTIDQVDGEIIELLAQRMGVSREIGRLKKERNIAVLQPERWRRILEERIEGGRARGLSERFMFRLYQYIHEESIRCQELAADDVRPSPGPERELEP